MGSENKKSTHYCYKIEANWHVWFRDEWWCLPIGSNPANPKLRRLVRGTRHGE
jgi:hypothetical protein